ncbi:MAG: GGDEF domain-containing protein [Proteobacteria bacterium]|nr:GGDEF domain-containing protein [Pseudomonadota bacterium]
MAAAVDNKVWSLRRRLALGLAMAALLPAILFSVALLVSQWRRDHQNLSDSLDASVRLNAGLIDDFLESQQAAVRLLAESIADNPDTGGVRLANVLKAYPAMIRILWVDAKGSVVVAQDARGRQMLQIPHIGEGEAWFIAARTRYQPFITNVYRRIAYGDEVVVGVSAPILRGSEFKGALLAAIPVESLMRQSAESAARSQWELLLVDRENRVTFASRGLRFHALENAGTVGASLARVATAMDQPAREVELTGLLKSGASAYVKAVRMRNGWVLALVAPRQQMLAPLLPRILLLLGLLTVTMLCVVGMLGLQWRTLKRSIDALLQGLRGYVLGGRMDARKMGRLPGELEPLAQGIEELGARMNAAYAQVQQVLGEREQVIAERTESLNLAVTELSLQSRTDALTGTLNYRGFREACDRVWADPDSQPLAVLALDIDHFKRYNDLYGHAEGDVALRRFAGAVRSALFRSGDVLARPGGEEFTVLMPDCSLRQAMQAANRVCARVREADISHDDTPSGRLTVSIGVAAREPGDVDVDALLKRADDALYRAKSGGRDRASS